MKFNKNIPPIISAIILISGNCDAAVANGKLEFNESTINNTYILKSKDAEIRLTNDCKATSNKFGDGTWSWSNAGYTVKLKNMKLFFGRQEVDLKNTDKCMD